MSGSVADNFPFGCFHNTKTYEEILSDCEINQRIRELLADININMYRGRYKTYDYLFKSAYWICGMFTHPAYMMARPGTIEEMYEAVEKYALCNDPCMHFHRIDSTGSCLIRCIAYLILHRMSEQIEGTAQIADSLESDLFSNPLLAPYLRKFNNENRKKYNFNFGIKPHSPQYWKEINVLFILGEDINDPWCYGTAEKFILQFVNCWESHEDRRAMIEKVRTSFCSDEWLMPYKEDNSEEEYIVLYNNAADKALTLLEEEYREVKGITEKPDANVERVYDSFPSPTINIHHVDTLNNYHGECNVSTVWKSETVQTIRNGETRTAPFSSLVVDQSKREVVLKKLHELVERPGKPKTILMPIRAAMDAGVISRPTWEQFCSEFGMNRVKSKSSLTDYINENYCYVGEDFESMKRIFSQLLM